MLVSYVFKMRIIIAGSREITDYDYVRLACELTSFRPTEIVSGKAKRGVDTLGEAWAREVGLPIKEFPADWERYGRGAGMRRNSEMAAYADGLIAIWDGESPGTLDMISKMKGRREVWIDGQLYD